MEPIICVHGGVGSPAEWSDGCVPAAEVGAKVLAGGGSALEAVLAAVCVLEDDGRFNAGRGSVLRMDGKTIETDAGVMDSDGLMGAVAALRGFRHPILAARAVADTPHILLAGEGATAFAGNCGLERATMEPTKAALDRHARAVKMLRERTSRRPSWREADLDAIWNFPGPLPEELRPHDTVGAVARDAQGRFATANSTGGAVPMMLGRVGDSPIPGAGWWAGEYGAVATTGMGEEIIRRMAAREIYASLEQGMSAEEATERVTALFPDEISFGAVTVTATSHGVVANRDMAQAIATP